MPKDNPEDPLDEIVLQALGQASYLFMSKPVLATTIVMPTEELKTIGTEAVAAIQQLLDSKVKEAQIKRLEAFLLAWSGDMSPEPLDSMRFQVRELKAELEGSE